MFAFSGAVEESSVEEGDLNVQDEIIKNITNKSSMTCVSLNPALSHNLSLKLMLQHSVIQDFSFRSVHASVCIYLFIYLFIQKNLMEFLNKYDVLHQSQSGFRSGHNGNSINVDGRTLAEGS